MPGDTSDDKNEQISATNPNSNPSKGNTEDGKKEIEDTANKENVQGLPDWIKGVKDPPIQTVAGNRRDGFTD